MPDIRVVTLLVALTPGVVLAQASEPESTPPPPLVAAPEQPVPGPALPQAPGMEERQAERPSPVSPGRVVIEVLGGGVGGVAGTLLGLLAAGAAGAEQWDCRGDVCQARVLGAMAIMGCALGSAGSVYGVGTVMDGRGRFLPTMAAGLAMGGVSAGLFLAGIEDSPEVVIPIMALPLVTSIVAYEVSAALAPAPSRGRTASRAPGATWAPTIALTSGGGALGLTGRF